MATGVLIFAFWHKCIDSSYNNNIAIALVSSFKRKDHIAGVAPVFSHS
jgi:hypothetical protein